MTALLELKQKLKNFYGQYEAYLLPVIKFAVALTFFYWIDESLGYMQQLNSLFVILILALICCILPPVVTVCVGFAMIFLHAYALGIEAAVFTGVLLLLLAVLFLRFSGGQSIVLVCTPLSYILDIPVLLPIGSGLLGSALTVFPAGCGVIIYYYVRQLHREAEVLAGSSLQMLDKIRLLADGLLQNWAMWLTIIAFIAVILMVNLIRTRSFDYAWRVSIITGGVVYVIVMIAGSFFMEVTLSYVPLIVQTVISVVIGMVLEFFFFGGDYSRTERLEYEDDEYYYYVKAVPKAVVATTDRSVKRITGQPEKEERRMKEVPQTGDRRNVKQEMTQAPVDSSADMEEIDFEKKLEESLRDL